MVRAAHHRAVSEKGGAIEDGGAWAPLCALDSSSQAGSQLAGCLGVGGQWDPDLSSSGAEEPGLGLACSYSAPTDTWALVPPAMCLWSCSPVLRPMLGPSGFSDLLVFLLGSLDLRMPLCFSTFLPPFGL